ncbi:hypothetical protein [Haloarchaeobius sp. DT45]|uniref:hypothetical protein n=1 Tax=Haloarchaeobius sp. DT45 TaxID=3446116 RepID=UPI003F6C109E
MPSSTASRPDPVTVVATRRFVQVAPETLWDAIGDPGALERAVTLVDATVTVTEQSYPRLVLDVRGDGDYGGLTGTVVLTVDANEFASVLHWECRIRPSGDLGTMRPRRFRPTVTRFVDAYAGEVNDRLPER